MMPEQDNLSNISEYMDKHYPDFVSVRVGLKNLNPGIEFLGLEPWGNCPEFPLNVYYHMMLSFDKNWFPPNLDFPDEVICTADWTTLDLPIGDFVIKQNYLFIYFHPFIVEVTVFTKDGKTTVS